ncbi:MAG: hypothetical protein Q8S33_12590 [Myxococcales bacterium]|nr:hypothetical protein [Myxococcales bacterium]
MRSLAVVAALCAAVSAAEPEHVTVGAYLRNVEAIDLEQNAYHLNVVLWFKWKGERDPTKSVRFVNLLEAWALSQVPVFEEPLTLPDGSRYQRLNVEGRFFHKFWLGTFPLDWQKVLLELEDSQRTEAQLVFDLDPASGIVPELAVPGWNVKELVNEERRVEVPGAFGLSGPLKTSRFRFGVVLQRPLRVLFTTMLPPLVLVLLCCWFVFFLEPVHVEARVGTVITALLTIVFLQLAFTDDLPYLGSTVLLDQLFNLSYLVITAILFECVTVTRLFDRAKALEARLPSVSGEDLRAAESELTAVRGRVARLDALARRWFPVAYVVGCGLIILLARGSEVFSIPL